jgi:acetyl esterase
MPLHPQARALLQQAADSGLPALNELDPPAAREQAAAMNELVGDGPELPRVEEVSIPTSSGSVGGRRYAPLEPAGTIVWIHGGGWVIGDLESHDAMCRLLALESGCEVIAVHYRRAPEHPFPAPLEDCWDALRWASGQAGDRPLVLGGDSAGGNMAAVVAMMARDRGRPQLAAQVLVYPSVDFAEEFPSERENATAPILTSKDIANAGQLYFTSGAAQRTDPYASPLRGKHEDLPPALIQTAQFDPLRDHGPAYASALRAAGVDVRLTNYVDGVHGYLSLPGLVPAARQALGEAVAFLRERLA